MTKTFSHTWTPEKLATKSSREIELIRKNALRLGAADLVSMCDEVKKPQATSKLTRPPRSEHSDGDVVVGYHFVCARDRGVRLDEPGRFWSGSWVVAESNVRTSLKYGAYLALHETKAAPSYRQGQILTCRRSARDMLPSDLPGADSRREEGLEFLVQETSEPYAWVGGGTGEKGYRWAKRATSSKDGSIVSKGETT